MTLPEIRAAVEAYRKDGRMFSPRELMGMIEALLPIAEQHELALKATRYAAEICGELRNGQ